MRLLELPLRIQTALQEGKVSAGHARALLPLGDEASQLAFSERIIAEGLSVRDTERLVANKISEEDFPDSARGDRRKRTRDLQVESLQQELKAALGTKVLIKQGAKERGKIVIYYTSFKEFERLKSAIEGDGPSMAQRAA
jgi:ParB family chromosome partitioning protein